MVSIRLPFRYRGTATYSVIIIKSYSVIIIKSLYYTDEKTDDTENKWRFTCINYIIGSASVFFEKYMYTLVL